MPLFPQRGNHVESFVGRNTAGDTNENLFRVHEKLLLCQKIKLGQRSSMVGVLKGRNKLQIWECFAYPVLMLFQKE